MGFLLSSYTHTEDNFYLKKLHLTEIKTTKTKTHDKWEVISFFDEKGFLLRETNFYKKEIKSDYTYEYTIADTLLEIKRVDAIGKDVKKQKKIDRYYYSSLGQCYKYRVYFGDCDNPTHYEDNFIFEDGLLTGYSQGKMGAVKISLKYNEKKQKTQKMEIRNKTDTTLNTYVYNQLGLLTDHIMESNNNAVVYSGVVVWSNEKVNKVHIQFSGFDKRGNWTRSYFLTERGKVFRSKREIEYW